MRVLGTFQSRDAADAVKDALIADGFNPEDLIVMSNRQMPEPPEDAQLEPGTAGEPGFVGLEEKLGKFAMGLMGKKNTLEGDGTEGVGKEGALLSVSVATEAQAEKVKALLERHFVSDVEFSDE